jgi:hypothetical protein
MGVVPTPRSSSVSKVSSGISDTTYTNGIYKFMGASILNVSLSQGFNSSAGSLSLTLVEDIGDTFVEPDTPSVWAMSLPKGGVGSVVFPNSTQELNPNGFNHTNVPFYFCGICTSWTKNVINSGGKTISVNISDVREILRGVQCLLSGFALSQNIGTGDEENPVPRYQLVDNVIDCFGYWNYGMESELNEFGMPWNKVRDSLLGVGVTINDINIEFTFSGTAFFSTPDWYRIDGSTIDIVSLVSKVAADGGSDVVVTSRKINSNTILVEFKAIRRTNNNELSKSEINNFLTAREGMVESATVGKEFRNEPTSKIIVGGMKNSNYLALPSEYKADLHTENIGGTIVSFSFTNPKDGLGYSGTSSFTAGNTAGKEEYISRINAKFPGATITTQANRVENFDRFPHDIVARLFGGSSKHYSSDAVGNSFGETYLTNDIDSGAIFPFWGFSPGGEAGSSSDASSYPLIEPFIALDHLAFDYESELYANLTKKIPLVKIVIENLEVRNVQHSDVFLSGDGDSDERPFAKLDREANGDIKYILNSVNMPGYVRGLPLNTEVLRAALASEYCFYAIYGIYFPDIASSLGMYRINWAAIKSHVDVQKSLGNTADLESLNVASFMTYSANEADQEKLITSNKLDKTNTTLRLKEAAQRNMNILLQFNKIIYEKVREYADQHMGKSFLVCLPKSKIMQRIWNGLPVPTRIEKPEIEYTVSDRGYWENIPAEFDGLSNTEASTDQELQIKRRFQAEDGRFYAMAIMDWKPTGNASFNSNGINKALFQELPVSEFRPNRIANQNPDHVFISCSVSQLTRRPDLAIITLPSPVLFDPTDGMKGFGDLEASLTNSSDAPNASFAKLYKFLWYYIKYDNDARALIKSVANDNGEPFYSLASKIVKKWSHSLYVGMKGAYEIDMRSERVMDLKGVLIPLNSNWVSYGPWYATNEDAKGMVSIEVDNSLVPWNFERPNGAWDTNLNIAGIERLNRSLSVTDYIDNASIIVAGFPELGPSDNLGFNSNITTISVNFGIDGVRTIYNLSTYSAKPGTYRKSDYDNISQTLIDTRPTVNNTNNFNLLQKVAGPSYGTNFFQH